MDDNFRRTTILCAGRRWRKTTFGMRRCVQRMLQYDEQLLWTAPTYDQVRIAWDEFRKAADGVFNFIKGEMVAEWPYPGKRARVAFRSLDDPNNARGHTADGIVMDEAAFIDERAYYEVLSPIVMDTGGWLLIMSTPAGRNWLWREFQRAPERPADVLAIQAPTLGCRIGPDGLLREPHPLENPNIPFEEMLRLYLGSPERSFRQEYLAEFIEDSGTVFRGVRKQATGAFAEPYFGTFVIGVDWGRSNDFTVLTVIDCEKREVVDWDRFNQIDFAFQVQRLAGLWRKWSANNAACSIMAETNSIGVPNIEAIQRMGIPIYGWHASNLTKQQMIENLSLDIEQGNLRYPPIPELLAELEAYEMKRLPTGLIRYQAPQGLHDDAVISIGIANLASRTPMLSRLETTFQLEGYSEEDDDEPEILRAIRKQRLRDLKIVTV